MTRPSLQHGFPCPVRGKPARWEDNPSRLFCSPRCKLIDLGVWLDEAYRLASQEPLRDPPAA
ncbi:MAG: DNA gyrase inhibitor YacG [Candidatus Rokubacteria bacterium]|nr:DNA gyrase inhibitor YacG [Candidatus Rokubacteria bacterium]